MLKRFVDGRGNIKITISILGSGASEDSW
jgi:hypothetical protein